MPDPRWVISPPRLEAQIPNRSALALRNGGARHTVFGGIDFTWTLGAIAQKILLMKVVVYSL